MHCTDPKFCRFLLFTTLLILIPSAVDSAAVGGTLPLRGDMSVEQSAYGTTADGHKVTLFTCTNSHGNWMSLIDYGATMVELHMPDRDGRRENIILTCGNMDDWQKCQSYFGCVAGRFCNRIADGKFSINGIRHELAVNNDPNHLHGGVRGFDKLMWQARPLETSDAVGVRFTLQSPDGDEGYPGNLKVTADYLLNNDNEVLIFFTAETDKPTPVNLTNHNYWNLAGHDSGNHFKHELKINADKYLATDDTLIPTGVMMDVMETPLNFVEFRKIGERIDKVGGEVRGYDHCYVVRDHDGTLRPCATVRDPGSGRTMEIHSTQPGLQFYTGNFLDGGQGSGGYPQYSGFCLETQHFPDSPNQPEFPSTILMPGDVLEEKTVLRFSASTAGPSSR